MIESTEVVERALSAVRYAASHDVPYKMGGGARPTAPHPFAATGNRFPGHCDCSGLVHWCLGTRRGGYNTDGMVADAHRYSRGRFAYGKDGKIRPGPQRLFVPVADDDVRPGDVIVYPGPDRNHDGKRERAGHCGIVGGVEPGFVMYADGWETGLKVVHCRWRSSSVRVTDASYFDKDDTVIVRCKAGRSAR